MNSNLRIRIIENNMIYHTKYILIITDTNKKCFLLSEEEVKDKILEYFHNIKTKEEVDLYFNELLLKESYKYKNSEIVFQLRKYNIINSHIVYLSI